MAIFSIFFLINFRAKSRGKFKQFDFDLEQLIKKRVMFGLPLNILFWS